MSLTYFAGTTGPSLADTISVKGVAQPLTGASVRLRMRPQSGSALTVDAAATIVDAPNGVVRYDWAPTDLAVEGEYAYWWRVTLPGGQIEETPEGALEVRLHAATDWGSAGSSITVGPCAAWCTSDDVAEIPGVDAADYAPLIDAASAVLYEMSARQFPGVCTRTLRPCRTGCGGWVTTMPAWWGIADSPTGGVAPVYGWGGYYGSGCGCGSLSEVLLPSYPVVAMTSVKVDGVVVDPSLYRLDQRCKLVATGTYRWPACQNLALDDSQPGTWSVAYLFGVAPPTLGRLAAAQMALQLYRSLNPGATPCALPQGAQRVVRQGVTVEREAVMLLSKSLRGELTTGMPLVDAFLAAYNPSNLLRRPAVWTPDRQKGRRTNT